MATFEAGGPSTQVVLVFALVCSVRQMASNKRTQVVLSSPHHHLSLQRQHQRETKAHAHTPYVVPAPDDTHNGAVHLIDCGDGDARSSKLANLRARPSLSCPKAGRPMGAGPLSKLAHWRGEAEEAGRASGQLATKSNCSGGHRAVLFVAQLNQSTSCQFLQNSTGNDLIKPWCVINLDELAVELTCSAGICIEANKSV